MTDTLTLYGYFRSSASWRARLALEWKQVPYKKVSINLLKGEQKEDAYKAVNPAGKVPCLKLADGTIFPQSMAIFEYLEEQYPDHPMLPSDTVTRAKVRSVCQSIACDMHPLQNPSVLFKVAPESEADREAWVALWVGNGFNGLETVLSGTSGSRCFGDTMTMADFFLVPMVYNAIRYHVNMEPYPTILRLYDGLLKQEVFHKTHPGRQEDTPPEFREP